MGPKDSQLLMPCKIDQMVMLTQILGVFILFGKVTSGGKICGLFRKVTQYYIIVAVDLNMMLLFWFTIFAKVDGFERFKVVTCSALNADLGNVTF